MSIDDVVGGISCREVLEALSDYVDGELADDVRGRVADHVAGCRNCERFGGMFGAVVREVREQLAPRGDDEAAARLARLRGRLASSG